jgi:hypothetical protein
MHATREILIHHLQVEFCVLVSHMFQRILVLSSIPSFATNIHSAFENLTLSDSKRPKRKITEISDFEQPEICKRRIDQKFQVACTSHATCQKMLADLEELKLQNFLFIGTLEVHQVSTEIYQFLSEAKKEHGECFPKIHMHLKTLKIPVTSKESEIENTHSQTEFAENVANSIERIFGTDLANDLIAAKALTIQFYLNKQDEMNKVYRNGQFDFSSFQKLERIDLRVYETDFTDFRVSYHSTQKSHLLAQYLPKLLSESKSTVKYITIPLDWMSRSMEISSQVDSIVKRFSRDWRLLASKGNKIAGRITLEKV